MSEVERMARREPPSQFTQPEHKLYVHRPPSALLVMVCRARDLIMCDYNWLTRTGSSDPTVKLQVEGRGRSRTDLDPVQDAHPRMGRGLPVALR